MEPEEYRKMDAEEDRMWWYLATRGCMLRYLKKFLPDGTGPVLDGGCGTGGFLKLVGGAIPKADSIGIEMDSWATEMAMQKSGRPVVRGSVHQLPFRDRTLRAIVSTDVIYHKAVQEKEMIAESYRCLTKGGVLLVQAPAYTWMSSAHDARVSGVRRYTRSEVEAILQEAGFSILLATYRNTFLFPLMVLQRRLLKAKDGESDVKPFPAFVEMAFRAIMSIEQVILGMGMTFPFGGSVVVVGMKNE